MTQNSKVLSMLGLAAKAGKVASGEFSTEKEVKSGNACLVIVAEDASDNTKKCSETCVSIMKCLWRYLRQRKN